MELDNVGEWSSYINPDVWSAWFEDLSIGFLLSPQSTESTISRVPSLNWRNPVYAALLHGAGQGSAAHLGFHTVPVSL